MLENKFTIGAEDYEFDATTGICKQLNPLPFKYSIEYIQKRYSTYGELGPRMAYFRLGFLLGSLPEIPNKILDVGYGNGDFLKSCSDIIPNVFGNDIPPSYPISPIPTVDNIFEDTYDVVCFFDSLEHFTDPYIIRKLKTKYIFITLPHFHPELGHEWFVNWRHRKPNEHLWYFSEKGLVNFFESIGFGLVKLSAFEDTIRKNTEQSSPNILAGLFKLG